MKQAGISAYRLSKQLKMKSGTLRNWLDGRKNLTDTELTRLYDGVQVLVAEQLESQEEAS